MEGRRQGGGGLNTSTETARGVRLYVGGLGESVTSDDLRKTFSSLGAIESLEFIRSKGRSFAYLDFFPSSLNSLAKLFSIYNGCVWKGGRLRLEKAKEHYLTHLRREWAEDAQLDSSVSTNIDADMEKKTEPEGKRKNELCSEKQQLQIFFPRLRKVKSIPFSGTGKHKYSFRRIEVPSLPTYFCDCEEHSGPPHAVEAKKVPVMEEQDGGMNKEEVDMMNSVMNKLFHRENISEVACSEVKRALEEDNSIIAMDDLQSDENGVDSSTDEDNLIINMVKGQEMAMASQKSRFNEREGSKPGLTKEVHQKVLILQEGNDTNESVSATVGGKRSSKGDSDVAGNRLGSQYKKLESAHEQSTAGVPWSQKSSWRELVGNGGNSAFNISDIFLGISSSKKEPLSDNVPKSCGSENKDLQRHEDQKDQPNKLELVEEYAEAQPTKPDSASSKSGRGSSWLHKSSWTQLVGGNNVRSFSITQIVPSVSFEKLEQSKPDSMKAINSSDSKHDDVIAKDKREPTADGSINLGVANEGDVQITEATSQLIVARNIDASSQVIKEKHDSEIKETCDGDVAIGETCLFMRSAASLKEWANAKAALSGSRKRKRKEK